MKEREEKKGEIVIPKKPLLEGKALVKAGTEFATAVFVQKPRNLDKVLEDIKRECEFGGDSFYYSWTLKRGKSIGKKIEGGTIGLAIALARIWGNTATPITVVETEDCWMFTATFIDLETGFTNQRLFRYDRTGDLPGQYEDARKENIKFEIGQSKAKRNAILSSLPVWLVDGAVKLAKQSVMRNISKEGLAKATKRIVEFFAEHNIPDKLLVNYIGQPKASWTAETIAHLQGIQKSIEDKQVSPEEVRADMVEKEKEEPISVEKILKGKKKEDQPAKTEGKKKEPAGKKEAEIFHCENPQCGTEVPTDQVEDSKKEFGKILCFDCQMEMRS